MAGPFTANVEVAGPFKIESKPYIIASTDKLASKDVAEVTPAVPIGEVDIPMTTRRSARWAIISVVVVLGVVAAGFAIYRKNNSSLEKESGSNGRKMA